MSRKLSTYEAGAVNVPKSLFLLYLIFAANYLGNLFGCRIQEILTHNMWVKHLLGFMTLYIFVALVDNNSKWSNNPYKQLAFSIIAYFIFIITTRIEYHFWIAFILLCSGMYILEIYKQNNETTDEEYESLQNVQQIIAYILIGLIVIGFTIYFLQKRKEYENNFSLYKFLLGTPQCKKDGSPVLFRRKNPVVRVQLE